MGMACKQDEQVATIIKKKLFICNSFISYEFIKKLWRIVS